MEAVAPSGPSTRKRGEDLTFTSGSTQGIVDDQTGTRWDVTGRGVEGPLEGMSLSPVEEAYTAYWGAWAAFHPETRLWLGEGD